jgi:hypothetical protein
VRKLGRKGITLNSDGTYVVSLIQLTSATSANVESEVGTFTSTATTITFSPSKASCTEATVPPYTEKYQLSGNLLTVSDSGGVTVYQLDTSPASSIALAEGCFINGSFVPTPLTPTGECSGAGVSCSAVPCCSGYACATNGTCAAKCTQGSDCMSGCCFGASAFGTSSGLCEAASACIDAG